MREKQFTTDITAQQRRDMWEWDKRRRCPWLYKEVPPVTINELLEQAIALAREQYGEREYTYRRILHYWQSSRKRGQKGSWYTVIGIDPVTREVYEANVEQGKTDSRAAFFGKRPKTRYYDYCRDKTRDGWQDALIALIEEVTADVDDDMNLNSSNTPAPGSAPVAGLGSPERKGDLRCRDNSKMAILFTRSG